MGDCTGIDWYRLHCTRDCTVTPSQVLYPTLRTMHLLHTRRRDHPYQDIRDRPCRRDNDIIHVSRLVTSTTNTATG